MGMRPSMLTVVPSSPHTALRQLKETLFARKKPKNKTSRHFCHPDTTKLTIPLCSFYFELSLEKRLIEMVSIGKNATKNSIKVSKVSLR